MVRQALDLLGYAVSNERFESLHDAGVEHTPPLLEHPPIGYLMRQGMFEGVGMFREEMRLIEELGRLKMCEAAVQRGLGDIRNGLEQRQGYLGANDRSSLEQSLLLWRQAVDARCQHRLHRRWHLNGRQGVCQTVRAWHAHQRSRLDQRPHTLLQKEGIALGLGDQQPLER